MSRRSRQSGYVVKKGKMWHVRFYVDVDDKKRERKSVPVDPCKGKDKLTKSEAAKHATALPFQATTFGIECSIHFCNDWEFQRRDFMLSGIHA